MRASWHCRLVSKKTSERVVKLRLSSAARMAMRSSSMSLRMRTNSCTSLGATLRWASAMTRTGRLRLSLMSSSTPSLKVALKSIVWRRFGAWDTSSSTSSRKPSSRSLSASSSTRISRSSRCTEALFCRWSIILPGVQMTTSGLPRSSDAWARTFFAPPLTRLAVMPANRDSESSIAWH